MCIFLNGEDSFKSFFFLLRRFGCKFSRRFFTTANSFLLDVFRSSNPVGNCPSDAGIALRFLNLLKQVSSLQYQGRITDAFSANSESNSFIRTGLHTLFTDWGVSHRASFGVLDHNGTQSFSGRNRCCLLCDFFRIDLPCV
ncbi:hypothetical protein CEXT_623471 [Caerostris extrusa]|uniref:Uncharacterized protein n=1 Tax=Caerostris extrusa TaxID=172846 RepID=A0AAV4W9U9_CAEEX|nr:hypothetical protein CEXT_623471 [Caerostris extrusa]